MKFLRLISLSALLLVTPLAAAQPLNVLFYGNSFTQGVGSTRSVNDLFRDIAVAAGHDEPHAQPATAGGQDIEWHVNNNTGVINSRIRPGDDWDYVVLQEHSTKLTRAYSGSPRFPESVEESKETVVQLHEAVKQRSADVVPVLYETWARGPAHIWYNRAVPLFDGPSDMQAEVRAGYEALQGALDDAAGEEIARIAPVGTAWENANFDALHSSDNWHAQNRGTLLAALVIYGTIYDDSDTSSIDLSGVLGSLNLDSADGEFLTAAADATLNPIPEPSAALLGGVAMGLLGATRRRASDVW